MMSEAMGDGIAGESLLQADVYGLLLLSRREPAADLALVSYR